ncbi:GPO family capsid scaffolding protein [Kushneria phosphatilytica]|uniref:GPO family capsid scaffolding protein n=1 Tax=Kushneria phosphatilytica TaxID=657387 RepID=A0A1S1NVR7_9GAMM|nr:GPO family capsid scaffolding protein [Kushneria phosphatilytica]OHV11212.1 GPO family capsid scaffolding protein [Kushneria phosphatilytica]QEL12215.1 GPO family capsid scaffolding protein [Kushneria phosphatilytica]
MKWFRIATEGATTDGRKITSQWLEQMAKNFDPEKYGCRVNLEHIRGVLPDSPFKAYGDVTALKTEKNSDGKVQLLAQINPTDELKALNDKRQKIYTSMEVDPEFADTGEAYLVGLAVTDSPASLGTQMLQFSAGAGDASPLAGRKQRAENLFSAAVETELDFSEGDPEPDKRPSLLDSVKALFKKHDAKTREGFAAFKGDLEQTLGVIVERYGALETELEKRPTIEEHSELKQAHDQLKARFDELYAQLDNSPRHHSRTPATGSDGTIETDC